MPALRRPQSRRSSFPPSGRCWPPTPGRTVRNTPKQRGRINELEENLAHRACPGGRRGLRARNRSRDVDERAPHPRGHGPGCVRDRRRDRQGCARGPAGRAPRDGSRGTPGERRGIVGARIHARPRQRSGVGGPGPPRGDRRLLERTRAMSRLARAGFLVAFAAVLASSSARAAGPLAIYDAATRTPYAWPKGDVPVYVQDSGFGPLTKAQVDSMVAYAIGQWNAVPTSSFHAVIAGNFSDIG